MIDKTHPSYEIFAKAAKTNPAFARLLYDDGPEVFPPTPPAWDKFVTVPQPPPYLGRVNKPHAVVTVAAGEQGRELLAISRPLFELYASKIGADLVVLDWPGVPEWPIGSKFAIRSVLPLYRRIIYFDADVLIHPGTPSLLDLVPPGSVGMYDDLPELLRQGRVFFSEYLAFREHMGLQRLPKVECYLNTGVMVLDRSHAPVLDVPDRPIPALHCSEQHLFVARTVDLGFPIVELDKIYNWQHWADRGFRRAPDNACLHYSGFQSPGGHAHRLKLMAPRAASMLDPSTARKPSPLRPVAPGKPQEAKKPCGGCAGGREPQRVRRDRAEPVR